MHDCNSVPRFVSWITIFAKLWKPPGHRLEIYHPNEHYEFAQHQQPLIGENKTIPHQPNRPQLQSIMATLRTGKAQHQSSSNVDIPTTDDNNDSLPPVTTLGSDGGILCLGVFRTGTYSMTKALNTLGIDRVLHGMDMRGGMGRDDPVSQQWARAAWANLPFLRRVLYPQTAGIPPPWLKKEFLSNTTPFTRNDWDNLLGDYQSVTDVASLHTASLIEAYPHAKVVLCYRDPDSWAASVDDTLVKLLTGWMGTLVRWAEPLVDVHFVTQLWDILRAWFEVETAAEMRAVYREKFEAHYAKVRAMVPPGQLLEYRLGDGWGPLCEFLGRPVPEPGLPFPRVNEGRSLRRMLRIAMVIILLRALLVFLRFPIMLAGLWFLARAGQNLYFGKNG